jgi:hypothetical protein
MVKTIGFITKRFQRYNTQSRIPLSINIAGTSIVIALRNQVDVLYFSYRILCNNQYGR